MEKRLRKAARREKEIGMIRRALGDDAEAIARVQVDTWRTTYIGIVPEERMAKLDYARSADKWRQVLAPECSTRLFVAEDQDGQVVGFAAAGPLRQPVPGFDGELYAIYVLKAHQRQGHGRALVAAVAEDLRGRGFRSLVIWALSDNPCRGFYEALGGQVVAETETEMAGVKLVEVGYGWRDWSHLAAASKS
jgi:ribosomal protein S18 acetylase RimI-like enzyme